MAVITSGTIAIYIAGFVLNYSRGTITSDEYGIATVELDDDAEGFLWYWTFAFLWVFNLFMAIALFVIASAACIWYFSQDNCHAPVMKSFYRAFRYHLGSLAFGALLVAIVQMVRLVIAYFQKQLAASGNPNKALALLLSYLQYYVAYVERIIKFINRNGYIQIALNGKNFCMACKDAILLIMRNSLRFTALAGLGTIFIFIGTIAIVAGTCLLAYLEIIQFKIFIDRDLSNPFIPIVFVFLISYIVARQFTMVLGIALEAIMHCFILDEELAKSKGGVSAKHTPAPL